MRSQTHVPQQASQPARMEMPLLSDGSWQLGSPMPSLPRSQASELKLRCAMRCADAPAQRERERRAGWLPAAAPSVALRVPAQQPVLGLALLESSPCCPPPFSSLPLDNHSTPHITPYTPICLPAAPARESKTTRSSLSCPRTATLRARRSKLISRYIC